MPRHQILIPRLTHLRYSISKVYARWHNSLIVFIRKGVIPERVTMSLALPQASAMIEPLNLTHSQTL